MHTDLLINKNNWEFHLVTFHMQSTYLLKLTVRLTLQFVSVSRLSVRLGQTRSLVSRFGGAQNILWGQDFCFYYIKKILGKKKFGGAQKM